MHHTAKTMYPLIERYQEGGATQKEFCKTHNLSLAVLNYWISKYRRDQPKTESFIEVRPPSGGAFAEISFAGGAQVRFLSPIPATYLLDLLRCEIAHQ